IDKEADRAKELYDQGLLNLEIARQLGCSKSQVTRLLHHWFKSRGLTMPDGRSRRSHLIHKHQHPPLHQQIADQVMELVQKNRLLQDIAAELNVDRNVVTAAIQFWHESRKLPIPDGRTRRKTLPRQGNTRRRVQAF